MPSIIFIMSPMPAAPAGAVDGCAWSG
jgi:hypothetical protein